MPTSAELVQAALDNLAKLRTRAGQSLRAVRDGPGFTAAGQGRVTVAPGQTIGSGWGNSVWDQSVNGFTSAADRDAQWPAPQPGAVCWLDDVKAVYVYTGAAWVRQTVARGQRYGFTTDGQGQVVTPHGLGVAPTEITATVVRSITAASMDLRIVSRDPTNFTIAFYYNNTGWLNSAMPAGMGFDWAAWV
jgi:hypothetical protein